MNRPGSGIVTTFCSIAEMSVPIKFSVFLEIFPKVKASIIFKSLSTSFLSSSESLSAFLTNCLKSFKSGNKTYAFEMLAQPWIDDSKLTSVVFRLILSIVLTFWNIPSWDTALFEKGSLVVAWHS